MKQMFQGTNIYLMTQQESSEALVFESQIFS